MPGRRRIIPWRNDLCNIQTGCPMFQLRSLIRVRKPDVCPFLPQPDPSGGDQNDCCIIGWPYPGNHGLITIFLGGKCEKISDPDLHSGGGQPSGVLLPCPGKSSPANSGRKTNLCLLLYRWLTALSDHATHRGWA